MRRGILADKDQLNALSQRTLNSPFDTIFDALQRRCALILETGPITETQWRAIWERGRWSSAVLAARAAQGRIMDLVIAHRIDPNNAYRDRAIEELENLCSWSTWVDPCHNKMAADICTSEAAVATVIGLDWLWDDISPEKRDAMIRCVSEKALKPYLQAVKEKVWWHGCYHHWNVVVNAGMALVAMVMQDEDPQAAKVEEFARAGLKHFFNAFGDDGSWDEGTGYWGVTIRYLLLLAEADKNLRDDLSIYHARGIENTGLFPIYFTPNGHAASFGDFPIEPLHGTIYLLARQFGLKEVAWWLDTYSLGRDATTNGWSTAGLAMLFRPEDIDVPEKPSLDEVKIFPQTGWAAMADQWPRPGLYVAAKTGDMASNHAKSNMNSIQIQSGGEMMLVDFSRPPHAQQYGTPEQKRFFEVTAREHNTICTAGHDHHIDAHGSILESKSTKNYRWLACSAGGACGENTRFIRQVVMLVDPADGKGHSVIVLDELTNGAPEKFEQLWHTRGKVELDTKTQTGIITGIRNQIHVGLAATDKT
ncbi:MAG: DUF4962 domain-containing protein, partial [bacterium]|nr:DUF4962 domain-containing protein [bacterium]